MDENNFRFDPMFDNRKPQWSRKHNCYTDDYGDTMDALRGADDAHDITFCPFRPLPRIDTGGKWRNVTDEEFSEIIERTVSKDGSVSEG